LERSIGETRIFDRRWFDAQQSRAMQLHRGSGKEQITITHLRHAGASVTIPVTAPQ
jgi:hypothetical protein